MLRGIAKAGAQFAFGRVPGGARAYEALTRGVLGTGKSHVAKLTRVWPEYLELWREVGVDLDGARIWVHESGPTPLSPFAAYLATGIGGIGTLGSGRLRIRYLARSVNAALAAFPNADPARRQAIEALRWMNSAATAVEGLGGVVHEDVDCAAVPLRDRSVDLCHSGGALEHLRPRELEAFLGELKRVLRPGGLASHVVDHRDHLHHADHALPFLAHLAVPESAYEALFGHSLGYHNRLPAARIAEMFEAAGFERVMMRRFVLPERRFVSDEVALEACPGLDRSRLARGHREISDIDLRTAATHFLFRA